MLARDRNTLADDNNNNNNKIITLELGGDHHRHQLHLQAVQLQDQLEGQLPAPLQDGQTPSASEPCQPHQGGWTGERVEAQVLDRVQSGSAPVQRLRLLHQQPAQAAAPCGQPTT